MIRKSGHRFSLATNTERVCAEIMLKQKDRAGRRFEEKSSRSSPTNWPSTSHCRTVDIRGRPAEMVYRRVAYRIGRHVQVLSPAPGDCDPLGRVRTSIGTG